MKSALIAFSAAAFVAAAVTTVVAQGDVIAERKALMKANGAAMGELSPMAKGEKPFDAAVVKAALAKIEEDARAYDADRLYPEGTEQGDTRAAPTIWSDREGFKAAIEKFRADAAAAVAADPQDAAALGAALGQVGANCGTCHQTYRLSRS